MQKVENNYLMRKNLLIAQNTKRNIETSWSPSFYIDQYILKYSQIFKTCTYELNLPNPLSHKRVFSSKKHPTSYLTILQKY